MTDDVELVGLDEDPPDWAYEDKEERKPDDAGDDDGTT